jgi:threonine dehydrogenase-like Zn-dependent dehydrogenase
MELVLDWMARGTLALGRLVTHRFPLSAYRAALLTAMGKAQSRAFKVAFQMRPT